MNSYRMKRLNTNTLIFFQSNYPEELDVERRQTRFRVLITCSSLRQSLMFALCTKPYRNSYNFILPRSEAPLFWPFRVHWIVLTSPCSCHRQKSFP